MAEYPELRITVSEHITPTKLQKKLLSLINDEEVRIGVNRIIGNKVNEHVPIESGALRESMRVDADGITWGEGLAYAGYQYRGEIYGRNYPIYLNPGWIIMGDNGIPQNTGQQDSMQRQIIGWWSLPGEEKVPTGRELGKPGNYMGWRFGYSDPNTHHHWIDETIKNRNELISIQVQVTNYLKREAKKRNL